MRRVLVALPGLVLLLTLAVVLQHAEAVRRLVPGRGRAEEQKLRAEIEKASARLEQIQSPRQFVPR